MYAASFVLFGAKSQVPMKETKCLSFPLKNVQRCVDPNPCSV